MVSSAGDVNQDGYDDVIVGAFGDGGYGALYTGAVFIYLGSPTGILPSDDQKLTGIEFERSRFGASVAALGDVNQDGYDDVAVGAYGGGSSIVGQVSVYYGSADGIDASSELRFGASDGTVNDNFGFSVSAAGDVNGDGYSDLAVGAPAHHTRSTYRSTIYVYLGGPNGITASSEVLLIPQGDLTGCGQFLSGGGDLNGDGYDDLLIGCPRDSDDAGAAFVYYGSADGIQSGTSTRLTGTTDETTRGMGATVSHAGDLNGDGFGDVLVSAEHFLIFHGGPDGITNAGRVVTVPESATFGPVAGVGDTNGDGYADVLLGAPNDGRDEDWKGAAFLYYGSETGLNTTPRIKFVPSEAIRRADFGSAVAGAGDVDGDGLADLIVGAENDRYEQTGSAFLFHGIADAVPPNALPETSVQSEAGCGCTTQARPFVGFGLLLPLLLIRRARR